MSTYKLKDDSKDISGKNTILTYNLEPWQWNMLQECLKYKKINGQDIRIYNAENFEDIFCVSYFLGILNFSKVKPDDIKLFIYHLEESIKNLKAESDGKNYSLTIPLTYIINESANFVKTLPYLYLDNSIFNHKENLRLVLLQKIKDIEGKGRLRGADEIPLRTLRILYMYRWLLTHGWVDKGVWDKICKSIGLDLISYRSFQRDISIIRKIEHITYDIDSKRYILDSEVILKL